MRAEFKFTPKSRVSLTPSSAKYEEGEEPGTPLLCNKKAWQELGRKKRLEIMNEMKGQSKEGKTHSQPPLDILPIALYCFCNGPCLVIGNIRLSRVLEHHWKALSVVKAFLCQSHLLNRVRYVNEALGNSFSRDKGTRRDEKVDRDLQERTQTDSLPAQILLQSW